MIRLAAHEDIGALVEMGRKFHSMAPHGPMGEFDAGAVARMLTFLITAPEALVFTNDVGAIGGLMSPVYFNPEKKMMEETFWWAEKDGKALLKAFEAGAMEMGADFIMLSTLANEKSEIVDRVVTRMGFSAIERRYLKEVIR